MILCPLDPMPQKCLSPYRPRTGKNNIFQDKNIPFTDSSLPIFLFLNFQYSEFLVSIFLLFNFVRFVLKVSRSVAIEKTYMRESKFVYSVFQHPFTKNATGKVDRMCSPVYCTQIFQLRNFERVAPRLQSH